MSTHDPTTKIHVSVGMAAIIGNNTRNQKRKGPPD
jgi:hypothetical protein